LEVTPGDFRTVRSLDFLGGADRTYPTGNADGDPALSKTSANSPSRLRSPTALPVSSSPTASRCPSRQHSSWPTQPSGCASCLAANVCDVASARCRTPIWPWFVKRAHGLCPVSLGFLDLVKLNGCSRVNVDRSGSWTARAILTFCYARPSGVTHSNPYQTVGPSRREAGRDGGTNGNFAVLYGMPRRRSTSFP
jgi:hypothetical protein